MNPFNVYKGKKIKRTRMSTGIWDGYFIKPKKEKIENTIYLVLRPDKDEKAKKLFPDEKVVYLRYDKEKDLEKISEYNSL